MNKNEITVEQLGELIAQAKTGRINRENLQAFLRDPEVFFKTTTKDIFSVVVDFGMSLVEMVNAGKYDWKNDDITVNHFPITGSGKSEVDFQLVYLNKSANSEEVLLHMEKNNLRPATLAELLFFGMKYPEKQREFPIIALGSSWVDSGGSRRVPYLYGNDSKRSLYLGLRWFGSDWIDYCRFLAVRKAS
ncbi:MAG: hypothetical protein Q7J14_01460 [Candidatus Magasanikbacteria bacterium]|nr:hypothetical protein [Candidatus Magasanikbacteria bacterium]